MLATLPLLIASALFGLVSGAPIQIRAARSFNDLTIATGVAGNALAEAKVKFPGTGASLNKAQTAQFNDDARCAVLAEQAFLDAGAVASGSRAKDGVSAGLFKNKVLKLYGTLLIVQAQVAQNGGTASASQAAQIKELTEKLEANVKIDQTNAGVASSSPNFTC